MHMQSTPSRPASNVHAHDTTCAAFAAQSLKGPQVHSHSSIHFTTTLTLSSVLGWPTYYIHLTGFNRLEQNHLKLEGSMLFRLQLPDHTFRLFDPGVPSWLPSCLLFMVVCIRLPKLDIGCSMAVGYLANISSGTISGVDPSKAAGDWLVTITYT